MNDGARTRDIRLHKPALYQLSYAHHVLTTFSRAQRDQVYYNQRANFSTTSVEVEIACSDVGPGSATNAARR